MSGGRRLFLDLQVTYRHGKPSIAYLNFSGAPDRRAARTDEVQKGVLVDYLADGSPMGIEFIHPSAISLEEAVNIVQQVTGEAVPAEELAPLHYGAA